MCIYWPRRLQGASLPERQKQSHPQLWISKRRLVYDDVLLTFFQGNSATSPTSGSPVKPKSGSGLLSGLKKPFQQIKKQLSEQQGKQSSSASNLSNSSGEGGGRESKSLNHPSSFVKKSALTRSLRDFKTSLTAGVSSRYGHMHSFFLSGFSPSGCCLVLSSPVSYAGEVQINEGQSPSQTGMDIAAKKTEVIRKNQTIQLC